MEWYETLAAGDGPGIIVYYKNAQGQTGSKMFRRGNAEALFDELANSAQIMDMVNAATKRIEQRRIESFGARTRKPTTPDDGVSLEDLGL